MTDRLRRALPLRSFPHLVLVVGPARSGIADAGVYVLPGIVGGYVLPVVPASWMSAGCRLLWDRWMSTCCLLLWHHGRLRGTFGSGAVGEFSPMSGLGHEYVSASLPTSIDSQALESDGLELVIPCARQWLERGQACWCE